jgi:hypothetical protein
MSELQLQGGGHGTDRRCHEVGDQPVETNCDVGKPASPLPDGQHPELAVLRRWALSEPMGHLPLILGDLAPQRVGPVLSHVSLTALLITNGMPNSA